METSARDCSELLGGSKPALPAPASPRVGGTGDSARRLRLSRSATCGAKQRDGSPPRMKEKRDSPGGNQNHLRNFTRSAIQDFSPDPFLLTLTPFWSADPFLLTP